MQTANQAHTGMTNNFLLCETYICMLTTLERRLTGEEGDTKDWGEEEKRAGHTSMDSECSSSESCGYGNMHAWMDAWMHGWMDMHVHVKAGFSYVVAGSAIEMMLAAQSNSRMLLAFFLAFKLLQVLCCTCMQHHSTALPVTM